MKDGKTTSRNHPPSSVTDMESGVGHEPVATQKIERFDTQVRITIRSVRKRLADPDGISGKAAIDGIVKAGILFDDSHHFVEEIVHKQAKVVKGEAERTIIVVEEI